MEQNIELVVYGILNKTVKHEGTWWPLFLSPVLSQFYKVSLELDNILLVSPPSCE